MLYKGYLINNAMAKQTYAKYASIILELAIDKTLDYGIPEDLLPKMQRGVQVEVPVRGHLRVGYVFEVKDHSDFDRHLPIAKVRSDGPLVSPELFDLALWMSKYYCAPLREVIKTIVPASVRKDVKPKQQLYVMRAKTREQLREHCENIRQTHAAQADVLDVMLQVKKGILLSELLEETQGSRSPVDTLAKHGWLSVDIVRVDRSPLINEEYIQTKPKALNPEQAAALHKILLSINENKFETHLLYGVTGSGKTEVYLQAIDRALELGKGVIMLVPEISLTAQTIERFRSRFKNRIAILHHRLSQGERYDEWCHIQRGEAQIVIGARSAVFSPVVNLGLIIVDEEHEHTYKQNDDTPCYHGRDLAVMRARMTNATVILGSATPSLESYHNSLHGKYTLSKLSCRADTARMPTVKIIDMRHEYEKAKSLTSFSDALLDGIKKRIASGEQTILFLNRRGYHTTMLCKTCGTTVKCQHCDVSLTFHLNENILACHLCGFQYSPPPRFCLKCKSEDPMKFRGVGTEQVERALHAILPEVRTIRIDADTTRHKGSHQKLLRDFGTGKADVLIGTQMIAKGLHFPEVTLVGVLNSDSSLNIPDFRASETIFQLITQVAGRSGRGILNGEVIIQTTMPDNDTIQLASQQDYEAFYQKEIEIRKMFHYPPFANLVKITFSGSHEAATMKSANDFRQLLLAFLAKSFEVHPVVPSGHSKVKDLFRFQFLIRGPGIYPINHAIEKTKEKFKYSQDIKIYVDINPTSTFF